MQADVTQPWVQPALHRVIRIAGRANETRVALEDDFHHFRVAVHHDGTRVTAVSSESPRTPYSLCPAAGAQLQELVGMLLTTDLPSVIRHTDARLQCTHQYDLAAIGITAAARGTTSRRYDITIPDAVAGNLLARLQRDGDTILEWGITDYAITSPQAFAGRGLGAGFTEWVDRTLPDDAAEAALVLRRGVFISRGRGMAAYLDAQPTATPQGGCWVKQAGNAERARREIGSTLDFTGRSAALTQDDEAWLAFVP